MNKLISVIIPVKNGKNYLSQALDGVCAQNMNTEIIVVDDGSDDDCWTIAEKLGCTVIHHEKSYGPAVCKNTALSKANGEYVLFHDHDDVMNNGVLNNMYEYMENHLDTYAVMAKVKDFVSPEINNEKLSPRKEAYYGLFSGAILIRKKVFDIIGLFDENIQAGDVIDFTLRMNKHGLKMDKLDIVATNRRLHNTNYGVTKKESEYKDYFALLRKGIKNGR